MDKSTYRNTCINTLKNISDDDYQKKSAAISKRLFEMNEFKEAIVIAITISRLTEVETRGIVEECWAKGKQVAIPKTNPKEKTMEFRRITSFKQMETVYLDLEEPIVHLSDVVLPSELDLIIVPGVVFSESGYRIGYGGGYYDRFLERFTGSTLALAFELQVIKSIPQESHDVPVQKIITEERVIECNMLD